MNELINERVKKMNALEEKLARELFGCSYNELDEDERADVAFEMHDMMKGE